MSDVERLRVPEQPPLAVLSPGLAAYLSRRLPSKQLRVDAQRARLMGNEGLARDIESLLLRLRYAEQWQRDHALGAEIAEGSEVGVPETSSGSERPTSLDVGTAAGLLGVCERRVRQLIAAGALEASRPSGQRKWVIDRQAVDEYLALRRSR